MPVVAAYLIMSHPNADQQNVEESMRFANSLGIRVMLSEFSPIPGTPDGELCRQWIDGRVLWGDAVFVNSELLEPIA